MKKLLLAGAALLTLAAASAPATAADLYRAAPMKAPAYAPPPFYSWTGFYLGGNAGYGWGESKWDNAVFPTGSFDVSGGLIGLTYGYNWQYGPWVFGFEGDINWTNIDGSTRTGCAPGCETSNSWFGTARGRVGYAWDRFLPYITGGLAYGDINASVPGFAGGSSTELGWTIGAGVEYGINRNWSVKAEYLYVDLGKFDCGVSCGAPPPDNVHFHTNIVRGGVNYRF